MPFRALEQAPRLPGSEGFVQGGGAMGVQIIESQAHPLGVAMDDVEQPPDAPGGILRRDSVRTISRQARSGSQNRNRLHVPLRRYSLSQGASWPGCAGSGLCTSAISGLGVSSMHTAGRAGS